MSLISTWSTVADANGTLGGTPEYWPEGQAPSTVNNCARLMMATIRSQWNDAVWFDWGYAVVKVSGNSFTVATASWNTVTLPAAFVVDSRIKTLDSAGNYIYGTISSVTSTAASTLVTFTPDSHSLTATVTNVFNSIIPATNTPIPGLNIPTDVVTQEMQQIYAVDTGATNAAQITLVPVLPDYMAGQLITFKAAATNTGPTTLQVDALGSKTIKKLGGSSDLAAGDILIGQMVTVAYDGTNFEMVNPVANPSGGSSGYAAYATYDTTSGATATNNGSFNVTSLTYNSTGNVTITFTNAFSTAFYPAAGINGKGANAYGGSVAFMSGPSTSNPTTTTYVAQTTGSTFGVSESPFAQIIFAR